MYIKSGDTVVVISGEYKDLAKKRKVMRVDPKANKVVVEGANLASRHQKPRRQGEEGGIIKLETPMYVSKVMLVCPKCDAPRRIGYEISGTGKDRKKVRICRKCGSKI